MNKALRVLPAQANKHVAAVTNESGLMALTSVNHTASSYDVCCRSSSIMYKCTLLTTYIPQESLQ